MARSYYYARNGKEHGPVSVAELQDRVRNSRLSPTDLVWTEGMPEWKPATEIPGLITTAPDAAGSVTPASSLPFTDPEPAGQTPDASSTAATPTSSATANPSATTLRAARQRFMQFLDMARTTAVSTGQHLGQVVTCGIAQGKIGIARREAVRSRTALGQKMYSIGLGNADERRIINDLEVRIQNAKAAGNSARRIEQELDSAHAALAAPTVEGDQSPAGLEAEFQTARHARNTFLAAQQTAVTARASLRTTHAQQGLRIGIGYLSLFLILSSIIWASRGSHTAASRPGNSGQAAQGEGEGENITAGPGDTTTLPDANTELTQSSGNNTQTTLCLRCNGTGQSNCDNCFGTGKRTCFNCNGSGTTANRMQCFQCNGTGQQRCSFCQYGKVQCPQCGGRGQQ